MDRTKPFQSGSVIFRQPNIRRLQSLLCDLSIKYDRKLARNAEKAAHSLIKGMKTPQDLAVSCDLILQLDGCEPTEIQQRFRSAFWIHVKSLKGGHLIDCILAAVLLRMQVTCCCVLRRESKV